MVTVSFTVPDPEMNCQDCKFWDADRFFCNQFTVPTSRSDDRRYACRELAKDPSKIDLIFEMVRQAGFEDGQEYWN